MIPPATSFARQQDACSPAPALRVLILTAGFGEGHNAAARNLAEAFNLTPARSAAHVVDLFALASPRLNAVTRRGYLSLINRAPKIWSAFYRWIDRSQLLPGGLWMLARETRLLARLIAQRQPDIICSTYPAYGFMLERLARQGRLAVPYFTIVTDSISINSLWWRPACDGWFVPNADSAAVLRSVGLDDRRVHDCGFPTPAFIVDHARLAPPDLTAGGRPRLLYIINSGTHQALETARRLLAETNWEITCAVGRDENLRGQLERLVARRPVPAAILGWTDEIPRLLLTHHVVISKAGGATTQEAIAARCPMIVNQIVPGQEEGNYELLRRHGIGALAQTPGAVVSACRRAFADRGALWHKWRTALAPLSRPDASRDIADRILAEARKKKFPAPVPVSVAFPTRLRSLPDGGRTSAAPDTLPV